MQGDTPQSQYSRHGPTVPYEPPIRPDDRDPETQSETRESTERWVYWSQEIRAARVAEDTWRKEGAAAEEIFYGKAEQAFSETGWDKAGDRTNILHSNITILKPLLYSTSPQALIRRRWGGDGAENDPTPRIAALVAERMAQFMVEDSGFDDGLEAARDDWLIPGRGEARVMYSRQTTSTGEPRGKVRVVHWPWRRILYAPAETWDDTPWKAYEIHMTRKRVEDRFGLDVARQMTYPITGLSDAQAGMEVQDDNTRAFGEVSGSEGLQGNATSPSSRDMARIYEIWDRSEGKLVWFSPDYQDDILDQEPDIHQLRGFFDAAKPLLAITRGGRLVPRPEIAFYKARADEIDQATKKLGSILKMIAVAGAYPGNAAEEVEKILQGENILVAVNDWAAFIEKFGGSSGLIQWLPLEAMIKAAQALFSMRDQSKQMLYEISGISDIVRGATDPNETASAQNIKGNYASLRLSHRRNRMARYARDTIAIMLDMAFQHLSQEEIARITEIKLPLTDAALEEMHRLKQQAMTEWSMLAQIAQQTGQAAPPQPKIPQFENTSWERVLRLLRDDLDRAFSLSVETDATVMDNADQDKALRMEFLTAFAQMADGLYPMAASGMVSLKVIKEMMLFAVRGFPKSRTLEGMLAELPDEMPQQEADQEPVQVTVANIQAQVNQIIKAMEIEADKAAQAADHEHELRTKTMDMLEGTLPQQ